MNLKAYTIQFTVRYEEQEYNLETYEREYRNLMVMLRDQISPDDFGQCGGMGRCGTCLVRIPGALNVGSYRNEESTLAKMGIMDPEVRLSCQVQIDETLDGAVIQMMDNI